MLLMRWPLSCKRDLAAIFWSTLLIRFRFVSLSSLLSTTLSLSLPFVTWLRDISWKFASNQIGKIVTRKNAPRIRGKFILQSVKLFILCNLSSLFFPSFLLSFFLFLFLSLSLSFHRPRPVFGHENFSNASRFQCIKDGGRDYLYKKEGLRVSSRKREHSEGRKSSFLLSSTERERERFFWRNKDIDLVTDLSSYPAHTTLSLFTNSVL